MKKNLLTLARDHDFNTIEEFLNYIIESYINGNKYQVKTLFNDMKKEDQENFLNNWLKVGEHFHELVKAICIKELLK